MNNDQHELNQKYPTHNKNHQWAGKREGVDRKISWMQRFKKLWKLGPRLAHKNMKKMINLFDYRSHKDIY